MSQHKEHPANNDVRTTIRMERRIHRKLAHHAIEAGSSINAIINAGIDLWLNQYEKRKEKMN